MRGEARVGIVRALAGFFNRGDDSHGGDHRRHLRSDLRDLHRNGFHLLHRDGDLRLHRDGDLRLRSLVPEQRQRARSERPTSGSAISRV